MAATISSYVYIDKHRYMTYSTSMNRTTNQHRHGEGATAMDLVSRLDLVEAIIRDRERDAAAEMQLRAALASRSTSRRRSLADRLTVVLGGSTSPSRIASTS